MTEFLSDEIFLTNTAAKRIYADIKDMPVFDYHCHLDPKEIFEDRVFSDIGELWLESDHYKWRVMRNFGISENLITGNADYRDKFFAFSAAIESFIGNPVYHWAHLELKKYFGINEPLSERTAQYVWDRTKELMADGSYSARNLICRSNVDTVITTDDPVSDLRYHKLLKEWESRFRVLPCFRPDKAINIASDGFVDYIASLSEAAEKEIGNFADLTCALESRLEYFIENGCVAADISFENFPDAKYDEVAADACLKDALAGERIAKERASVYVFTLVAALMRMIAKRNIVLQIHTGVIRNCNSSRYSALGADCGIDSVGNALDIVAGTRLFDFAESEGAMPRTIVYTLNPNSYYPLATMVGNFSGKSKGSMQLGAAWWFLDHRDGIKEQLKTFANTSGLGLFNGMLTDSRSFVSYARHDYFRRILSSVLGEWVEDGEYPSDGVCGIARKIAFENAKNFFGGIK